MSMQDKLMDDLKTSMKTKNKIRKDVITMVRSDVKQREVDERVELTDEDVIEIISKQLKQRKDSIVEFQKGDRQDLVERSEAEIEILLEYLPLQLTEDELDKIVKGTIEEVNAETPKDMGKIMGSIMPKIKGRADGSLVNKLVLKYLK